MRNRRRPVSLTPKALVAAGVTAALAFSPEAGAGRSWTLATRAEVSPEGDSAGAPSPPPVAPANVAVVEVLGPLRQRATWEMCEGLTDGYDAIEVRFADAIASGATDVAVIVDSPGGEVAGGFAAMRRMRSAADRAGVRVWTVADECACSMGYALLCLGDKGRVHCPGLGMTGSVGVVRMLADASGALEKEGVAVTIVRSGERKMRPSGIEPIDKADLDRAQAMVDAAAEDFAAWVSERRGVDAKDVLALMGEAMTGEEAFAAGLVDGTSNAKEVLAMTTAEAALSALREALGLAATASQDQTVARATEAKAALDALPGVRAQLAEKDAALLARNAADEKTRAESVAAQKRTAFAAEVQALVAAGRVTPASARELLGEAADPAKGAAATPGYYDVHGEAAARRTLALVTSEASQVPKAGAKPGAVPMPTNADPALVARAKQLGVDPNEYAAHVAGEVTP